MGEIESTRLGTGRLYGLHSHIIAILLGSGMGLACILTVIYLSINYVSLVSRFSHENDLRLIKLEKMLSVPVLKQDFVMVVDIIDAEVEGGGLQYIWVVEKGLVIASNDPDHVMHPLDIGYVSRKGFTSITTPDGFSIAILPDYSIISTISLRILAGALAAVLLVIVMSMSLATRLSRRISDPIASAVAASSHIAQGSFDIRFEDTRIPEINTLFHSLSETASQLKTLTENLEKEKRRIALSEEKYRRLVENLPDTYFFFSFTPDGHITYLSPSAKSILGPEAMDMTRISRHLLSNRALSIALLGSRNAPRKPYEIEVPSDDGTTRLLEVLEVPVFDKEGKLSLIEGIARDVTFEKRAEQELFQAQKMETIGSLAGGIAHDFNNILGGIVGTLSILKHKLRLPGGVKNADLENYLDVMENAGQNASLLVNQLLTLSRKQEFHLAPIDLNDTLKYVVKICENTFDRSIRIETAYFPEKALAMADPVQIEQVLLNLCVNASHAMTTMRGDDDPWGGEMHLSLTRVDPSADFSLAHVQSSEQPHWVVTVSDTGVGMDSHTQARIFDPFFTTKTQGSGTGLGLSVAYNIIKQHKGFITTYSEPGLGTTMKVYIPVLKGDNRVRVRALEDTIRTGSGTILVVDDDETIRTIARVILQECGYEVLEAGNGSEGVEIFLEKHHRIAAVLLDMVMPELSGKETFEALKRIDPAVRVLISSGFKNDDRVKKVLAMGASDFIQKPFTLHSLSEAMHKVVFGG